MHLRTCDTGMACRIIHRQLVDLKSESPELISERPAITMQFAEPLQQALLCCLQRRVQHRRTCPLAQSSPAAVAVSVLPWLRCSRAEQTVSKIHAVRRQFGTSTPCRVFPLHVLQHQRLHTIQCTCLCLQETPQPCFVISLSAIVWPCSISE